MKLCIHEHLTDDGTIERTYLSREGDALRLRIEAFRDDALATRGPTRRGENADGLLPIEALVRVMKKFGKPLASGIAPSASEWLDLGGGCSLARLRHLARYDVIARDFLVFRAPGEEPLVELATSVTAALMHLLAAFAS